MKFNDFKLLVLDMDGTALNNNHRFGDLTVKTLNYLLKHDVKIMLATGRSFTNCLPALMETEFDCNNPNVFLAGLNGSQLKQIENNKIIMTAPIAPEEADSLVKSIELDHEEKIICAFGYKNHNYDTVYFLINDDHDFAKDYLENFYDSFKQLKLSDHANLIVQCKIDQLDKYEVLKFFVVMKQNSLDNLIADWQNRLTMSYEMMPFYRGYYISEITAKGVSKAKAIETLCMDFHFDPATNVICFGNESNDVPMFKYVKHAIAMKNALPHIQEQAAFTSDYTNNEDGVAKWLIERFNLPVKGQGVSASVSILLRMETIVIQGGRKQGEKWLKIF